MPTYTARCKSCEHVQDYYETISNCEKTPPCEKCAHEMEKIISLSNIAPDFEPYLDPNLGGPRGVWVKSKQHRKQLMREYGVEEKVGKGWY